MPKKQLQNKSAKSKKRYVKLKDTADPDSAFVVKKLKEGLPFTTLVGQYLGYLARCHPQCRFVIGHSGEHFAFLHDRNGSAAQVIFDPAKCTFARSCLNRVYSPIPVDLHLNDYFVCNRKRDQLAVIVLAW